MTKEQLAEIRNRADAASPAPWHYVHGYGFCSKNTELNISDGPPDANTEFIKHARQDIPNLLHELEVLQAGEGYIAGLLEKMQKEIIELKAECLRLTEENERLDNDPGHTRRSN